eukprot:2141805-Prorocentrum_lima.AAC.1
MTSSLVGSEMCIRDSISSSVPGSTLLPFCGCWRRCLVLRGWCRVLCCWCCLLYTSDAADDM